MRRLGDFPRFTATGLPIFARSRPLAARCKLRIMVPCIRGPQNPYTALHFGSLDSFVRNNSNRVRRMQKCWFHGLLGSHFPDIAFGYQALFFAIGLVCLQLRRLLGNICCLCGIILLEVCIVEEAGPSWVATSIQSPSRARSSQKTAKKG